jgi:hypothetical protein
MEVSAAMDDLGTRLAEAADRAAQLARDPGPAAAWRRARARRRRRAGGAALALMVAALVVVIGRGGGLGLPTVDPLSQDRWRQLPWRGLQAREWKATVPNEQPHDPVVAAAQGEQAGEPWRLVVYRSTYRPGGGRAPVADVCYILDWFALDLGPPAWQAHGTCAPEAQTASVLAAGALGTARDAVAVIGRAPADATRVRLELRGRTAVEAATVAARDVPGRFYVAFVPRASHLERMVALDRDGRPVGEAPGPGDLTRDRLGGFPPTGPVTVVGRVTTRSGGLELVVWPVRDGYCVSLAMGAGGGGSSVCGGSGPEPGVAPGDGILEPKTHCSGSGVGRVDLRVAYGGVPRTARTVRIEAGGERVEVPARDGGEQLGRAFFLAEVTSKRPLGSVRITALAADGTTIRTWRRDGCG